MEKNHCDGRPNGSWCDSAKNIKTDGFMTTCDL